MADFFENAKYVLDNSKNEQLLRMCAEECSELTQVCLKGVRALTPEDYVKDSYDDIFEHLKEEIADVINTIDALIDAMEIEWCDIDDICCSKMQRWADRIKTMKEGNNNE